MKSIALPRSLKISIAVIICLIIFIFTFLIFMIKHSVANLNVILEIRKHFKKNIILS